MITQIDISNFGSFQNFVWRNAVRDIGGTVQNFKRLNIIYGRNYSGKTTLSQIFRSLQERKLPANFDNPSYTVDCTGGSITQAQIASHTLNVRVYNRDFVQDNLSFLTNQQGGEIKTFAIVGVENNDLVTEIAGIDTSLGSVATKTGLRYESSLKDLDQRQKAKKKAAAEECITEKLRRHAADTIKPNREYGRTNYNINDIKSDVQFVRDNDLALLEENESANKKSLLKESELSPVGKMIDFASGIEEIKNNAFELLRKKITPTEAIQELLNDRLLQVWVKTGIPHHRDKRVTCAFCRQPLPEDIWQVLDSHFSKESSELEASIDDSLSSITKEIESLAAIMIVSNTQLYAAERKDFDAAKTSLEQNLKLYKADLKEIAKSLNERKTVLFDAVSCPVVSFDVSKIADDIAKLNDAIGKSDMRTKTLSGDKDTARTALRRNDVANFIKQINLSADEAELKKLTTEATDATKEAQALTDQIKDLEKRAEFLRAQQKDERKGAERVNNLLNHFFGHDGIKLHAIDDGSAAGVRFQIMRGEKSAYNLSEGECSLVAFCYFVAKLEEADSRGKELIIYIDDPISSLDSNHVFFIYSVIESLIAKPTKNDDKSNRFNYAQLFISTHNLDFLKYLKRLSAPKDNHGGTGHFLIEKSTTPSVISPMPSYLKHYITEFNYLFHQIYKCRNAELAKTHPEPFFAFGNNLRKFLEAYLFYKYPYHDDLHNSTERLQKFFGDDDTSVALVNRLSNELSHLEEIFDRSMKPIEIPEIPKLANFVLEKLYVTDKDQYNSLLKSIGEPVRMA